MEKSIIKRHFEIEGKIPMEELAKKSANEHKSLFSEVMGWLSDYYKSEKSDMYGLAFYTIGVYATEHFIQDELIEKRQLK